MAKDFEIKLNSRIKQFCKSQGIEYSSIDEKKLFEKFSNYSIVGDIIKGNNFDINKISTGLSKGIDGIAIIVNGKLINEENDLELIGENEKIAITISFIQSTTISSFEYKKFESYNDTVVSFLTGALRIEPFSDIIDKIFDEESGLVDNISESTKVNVFFSSGKTSHVISEKEYSIEKSKFTTRNDFNFKFDIDNLEVIQENEICQRYDNIDSFLNVELKYDQEIALDEKEKITMSSLTVLSFNEYKKIIMNGENLRDNIFVENVRSKIKDSDVNKEILSTLQSNKDREYFIYFNNGITVLCKEIARHHTKKDVIIVKHPRVINGCQTSHMMYEHYKTRPEDLNDIGVVVKFIATEDTDLKKKIILATNNQNAIDKDLENLNTFHNKLEELFLGMHNFEIFYERLRGQYSDVYPAYKVIDKENIAKAYISIFLNLPHEMKSNSLSKIEKFKDRKQIFENSSEESLKEYYLSGVLFFYLNQFITTNQIQLESQTQDMHLLLVAYKLFKNKYNSTNNILDILKDKENVLNLFLEANQFIQSQRYLYEKRGFYSGPKTKLLLKELENGTNTTS